MSMEVTFSYAPRTGSTGSRSIIHLENLVLLFESTPPSFNLVHISSCKLGYVPPEFVENLPKELT